VALYRKYRPATFAEVVGQEHVTEPLSVALTTGRINHAYLFSGPRGCGKTSSARILARSLNCEQGPTATPCGVCDSCIGLAPGGAGTLDVVELDAASHGGVDDARELRDRAFYSPASSRYRVFIVDEAHMVSTQGFNALLKIVEEPPEHLVFIFATTEPEKVLATIRSRTHHYPFRLLAPAVMRGLLEQICAQEQVNAEAAVYPLVIRAGGGSPRDSLSVLDQLLAGAGPEGVTYQRALSLLGVTDVALIDDAVDALAADDGSALFGTVQRLVDAGHDPRRFATDLLERVRDLILLRAVPDAGDRGLVDAPGDVVERMRDEAERIGPATLARYAEVIHSGLGEMRGATAPRLLLEVMCARMLLPAASDAESAVLHRLERVERRMTITPPTEEDTHEQAFQRPSQRVAEVPPQAAPAAAEAPKPVAAPKPSTPATEPAPAPVEPPSRTIVAGQPDAATVRTVWSEVRTAVRERSRTTEVMLSSATVRRLEGDTLVLSHESVPLAKRLTEARNASVVREALRDVLGVDWNVVCESGSAQEELDAPTPVAAPPTPAPAVRYTRPSGSSTPTSPDDIPLPDGPTDLESESAPREPVDEESMLAEAASGALGDPAGRRDPEEMALELLAAELGATPLDQR